MLNYSKQTDTNLSLWMYFPDDATTVGIRIFRIRGFQNYKNGLLKI